VVAIGRRDPLELALWSRWKSGRSLVSNGDQLLPRALWASARHQDAFSRIIQQAFPKKNPYNRTASSKKGIMNKNK